MKTLRRFSALWQGAIIALSLSAADVSRAAPKPNPSAKPATPDAGTSFWLEGDAALNAGHLAEAVDAYRKAWDRRPNTYRLACKIGRTELRRGKYRDAAEWISRCIKLSPIATTPQDVEDAKDRTLELQTALQRISAVTIVSDEPDMRVVFNDSLVRKTPVIEDVYLEPGEQQIYAYKGLRSTSKTLSTVAGKEYRLVLALPPELPARSLLPPLKVPARVVDGVDWSKIPIPPPPWFRWWPVGLGGGLAGAGLITGLGLFTYSGVMDGNASNILSSIQADGKGCDATPMDSRCASYQRFADRSDAFSTAATVTFIATGAIVAGVIGYMIYENNRISLVLNGQGAAARYTW